MGRGGSVASVALRHAEQLTGSFRVVCVSEAFRPDLPSGVETAPVWLPDLSPLRRLGHVASELVFAASASLVLERIGEESGLDAAIFHSHPVAAVAARWIRRRLGAASVVVVHGDIFTRPSGTYDTLLTGLYRWLTPSAYAAVDGVAAVSGETGRAIRASGAEPSSTWVVPNGVAPDEIGFVDCPRPADDGGPPAVLFVGRLSVEKGIDMLLKASALLLSRGVEHRLILAGDGPLRESVEAARRRFGGERVAPLGFRPRAGLAGLYREAAVVCLPSRDDPAPLVALEAQLCGRPVVATRVGGLQTAVADGITGYLVAPDDPVELAGRLEALLVDRRLAERMGDAARERVTRVFSWEQTGEALRFLLDRVLGTSRVPS